MRVYIVNERQVEIPDQAQCGDEFLLRVRITDIHQEMVEVTSYGADEPQVLNGERSVNAIWLATRSMQHD